MDTDQLREHLLNINGVKEVFIDNQPKLPQEPTDIFIRPQTFLAPDTILEEVRDSISHLRTNRIFHVKLAKL